MPRLEGNHPAVMDDVPMYVTAAAPATDVQAVMVVIVLYKNR